MAWPQLLITVTARFVTATTRLTVGIQLNQLGAVINASAGSLARVESAARESLQAELCSVVRPEWVRWVSGADAEKEAKQLIEKGAQGLVVGGGDGTISAVAGVAAAAGVCLGVLPLGTRNHFARDLGVPADVGDAIRTLQDFRLRRIDLGEVNGTTFINNVSLGLYPKLVARREKFQRSRGWRKLTAHAAAAGYVLRRFPLSRVSVEVEGRLMMAKTPIVFVSNNVCRDGLLADARRPALDLGKLWVCVARTDSRLALMRMCRDFLLGRRDEIPGLDAEEVDAVTVTMRRRRMLVAVDGEVRHLASPLRLRSLPGALQVIAP
ncbi:diacylglycerol kinase family protein [Alkalilimnicola ehrlichii]|nr:diacylglycerol kinase family protein [Alkalilimnicola ehrlichii]